MFSSCPALCECDCADRGPIAVVQCRVNRARRLFDRGFGSIHPRCRLRLGLHRSGRAARTLAPRALRLVFALGTRWPWLWRRVLPATLEMFVKRGSGGFHFGFGFGEGRLDLLAGKLHLALDLFASALQSALDLPAGLLEIAALLVPSLAKVPTKVFEWIACHESPHHCSSHITHKCL